MSRVESAVQSATMPAKVSLHRGGVEVIDRWADDWRRLCDETSDDQPFYRPEWIAAHIRAFTPRAKVLLITITVDDRLCLALPLLEERAFLGGVPLRTLRAPVNSHSCRFDAVRCAGERGELAQQMLWQHFKHLRGWDLLELRAVPKDGILSSIAETAKADGFEVARIPLLPNLYVEIPSDSEALQKLPANKKLRSQLRGIRRDLAAKGTLKLQRFEGANSEGLQRFYRLESSGWKGAEGSAIISSFDTRQFYDEITHAAARFGYLCVYTLELNEQLLASHLGLSYKGRYFSPKVAYEEQFKQWAPGHLIVEEIAKDCAARGVHEYDITGANDAWKEKWTSQSRAQNVEMIFNRGLSGSLAHALQFRLKPWLKKRLAKRKNQKASADPSDNS